MTAAALVAFLMAAVKARPVVVPALVALTVMVSALAVVSVMMAVVAAFGVRIVGERSCCQRLRCGVSLTSFLTYVKNDDSTVSDICQQRSCV